MLELAGIEKIEYAKKINIDPSIGFDVGLQELVQTAEEDWNAGVKTNITIDGNKFYLTDSGLVGSLILGTFTIPYLKRFRSFILLSLPSRSDKVVVSISTSIDGVTFGSWISVYNGIIENVDPETHFKVKIEIAPNTVRVEVLQLRIIYQLSTNIAETEDVSFIEPIDSFQIYSTWGSDSYKGYQLLEDPLLGYEFSGYADRVFGGNGNLFIGFIDLKYFGFIDSDIQRRYGKYIPASIYDQEAIFREWKMVVMNDTTNLVEREITGLTWYGGRGINVYDSEFGEIDGSILPKVAFSMFRDDAYFLNPLNDGDYYSNEDLGKDVPVYRYMYFKWNHSIETENAVSGKTVMISAMYQDFYYRNDATKEQSFSLITNTSSFIQTLYQGAVNEFKLANMTLTAEGDRTVLENYRLIDDDSVDGSILAIIYGGFKNFMHSFFSGGIEYDSKIGLSENVLSMNVLDITKQLQKITVGDKLKDSGGLPYLNRSVFFLVTQMLFESGFYNTRQIDPILTDLIVEENIFTKNSDYVHTYKIDFKNYYILELIDGKFFLSLWEGLFENTDQSFPTRTELGFEGYNIIKNEEIAFQENSNIPYLYYYMIFQNNIDLSDIQSMVIRIHKERLNFETFIRQITFSPGVDPGSYSIQDIIITEKYEVQTDETLWNAREGNLQLYAGLVVIDRGYKAEDFFESDESGVINFDSYIITGNIDNLAGMKVLKPLPSSGSLLIFIQARWNDSESDLIESSIQTGFNGTWSYDAEWTAPVDVFNATYTIRFDKQQQTLPGGIGTFVFEMENENQQDGFATEDDAFDGAESWILDDYENLYSDLNIIQYNGCTLKNKYSFKIEDVEGIAIFQNVEGGLLFDPVDVLSFYSQCIFSSFPKEGADYQQSTELSETEMSYFRSVGNDIYENKLGNFIIQTTTHFEEDNVWNAINKMANIGSYYIGALLNGIFFSNSGSGGSLNVDDNNILNFSRLKLNRKDLINIVRITKNNGSVFEKRIQASIDEFGDKIIELDMPYIYTDSECEIIADSYLSRAFPIYESDIKLKYSPHLQIRDQGYIIVNDYVAGEIKAIKKISHNPSSFETIITALHVKSSHSEWGVAEWGTSEWG